MTLCVASKGGMGLDILCVMLLARSTVHMLLDRSTVHIIYSTHINYSTIIKIYSTLTFTALTSILLEVRTHHIRLMYDECSGWMRRLGLC